MHNRLIILKISKSCCCISIYVNVVVVVLKKNFSLVVVPQHNGVYLVLILIYDLFCPIIIKINMYLPGNSIKKEEKKKICTYVQLHMLILYKITYFLFIFIHTTHKEKTNKKLIYNLINFYKNK